MGRRKEFRKPMNVPRERDGGLRFYARATQSWVEAQPLPVPVVETPSGTWPAPGRGANGESSN